MDLSRKPSILADAAKYDASCASSGKADAAMSKAAGGPVAWGICHSYTPDGRCVSLLRLLLTDFCVYDCQYCVNRRSSDIPRARFSVDEVVRLTLDFYRRNYIEGLASYALTSRKTPIAALRGTPLPHPSGASLVVTYHPAAVLRADDGKAFYRALCEDLSRAAQMVG